MAEMVCTGLTRLRANRIWGRVGWGQVGLEHICPGPSCLETEGFGLGSSWLGADFTRELFTEYD